MRKAYLDAGLFRYSDTATATLRYAKLPHPIASIARFDASPAQRVD